jgi:hypothetical protein
MRLYTWDMEKGRWKVEGGAPGGEEQLKSGGRWRNVNLIPAETRPRATATPAPAFSQDLGAGAGAGADPLVCYYSYIYRSQVLRPASIGEFLYLMLCQDI